MSALFAGGWHGMAYIDAMNRGILDRFLVSPMRRGALVAAGFLYGTVVIVVQSLVIVGVAYADGARFSFGVDRRDLFVLAILLGGTVAALSDALALVARQEETLIGAVQFVILPATFLSSGMMAANLAARLDPRRRPLQPGQLGRHRFPCRFGRLGPRRHTGGDARGAPARVCRAGDASDPRVPAGRLVWPRGEELVGAAW